MAYKKDRYDGACYYKNKLLGKCTVADSQAFSLLLENCGGSAKRVLQEYSYFSTELKGILEKMAAIQDKEAQKNRPQQTSGIFSEPKNSPWGEVQTCDVLCPGVFVVSTAGHGGTMFSNDMTALLSPAARNCGMKHEEYLCFEEDSQESVALRELLDKKLWSIPDRIKDKAAFEENINNSIKEYNPDYWKSRQVGIEKAQTQKEHVSSHTNER